MTMDFLLKVGNDNGNSEQDIYIDKELFRQPNVYATIVNTKSYDEKSANSVVENIMDKILVGIQSTNISGTYLIGKSAVDSGERLNELDVDFDQKHESDLPIINTLGTIAAYSVQKYYKENGNTFPEKLVVGVHMTTALPIEEYYENPNNKVEFADNFKNGPHSVMVHVGNKRILVEVKFEAVMVLPEASPVIYSILNDVDGNVRQDHIFKDFQETYYADDSTIVDGSYFKDKQILHVDIGDGTTELPLTEGETPKDNFVTGHKLGAGHAITAALDEIAKITHMPTIRRQEASEIIRGRSLTKWQEKTMIALKPEIRKQAIDILGGVKKELKRARYEVDVILVYGGGSILMKEELYPELVKIGDKFDIKVLYVPEEFAIRMNADGLNNFVHGRIFDYIVKQQQKAKKAAEKTATIN